MSASLSHPFAGPDMRPTPTLAAVSIALGQGGWERPSAGAQRDSYRGFALVLLRRRHDRVAVKSIRAVNRCWASEAIVRFDYREIGKGASRGGRGGVSLLL